MKKVFLVDYENVSEDGLKGFEGLSEQDEVYLFYSANNGRISLNFVKNLYALKDTASLHFMKAFTGKQALDIQLATYLGSLIEADKEGQCKFIIVSKDKGFDHIRDFWNVYRPEVRICRSESITNGCVKPADAKAQGTEKEASALADVLAEKETKPKSTRKRSTSKSTKSQAKAQSAEKEQKSESGTAQPVKEQKTENAQEAPAKELKPENTSAAAQEQIQDNTQHLPGTGSSISGETQQAEAGKEKPENKKALPAETEAKPSLPAVKNGKTSLNAAVMQTLSKEKYDYKTVGQAASLAVSFVGQRYQKRETYKSMVRQFGQKEGLAIYNLIKGLL